MPFIPRKKPTTAQLGVFWKESDKGKRVGKRSPFYNPRYLHKPEFITRTMVGKVRAFTSRRGLLSYLKLVQRINRACQQKKFDHFFFQPTQILGVDRKNCRLIERGYLAPSILDIKTRSKNRYMGRFMRIMKEKGVDIHELVERIDLAYRELDGMKSGERFWDLHDENVLVLDFDPVTKKPTLVVIDHSILI